MRYPFAAEDPGAPGQPEWTVDCEVCNAKAGQECCSITTGCVLPRGHHERGKKQKGDAKRVAFARNPILTDEVLKAFRLAEYQLKHHGRYTAWNDDRRLRFCLDAAFAEALKPPPEKNPHDPR